ncbi:MAG: GNAT family N-acetyltransferase [Bacteroidetes bacterium]|nr:GNAT family N-acetyltransferase [Bacteroidota bacterium]
MEVKIREFQIEDYYNLISLWKKANLEYKPKGRDRRDKIEKELEDNPSFILLAEEDGELVGSVLGSHDGRKGWLNRLAVAPEYRKKSIARKLVNEAEKKLEKQGIEIIACLIEGWNKQSIKVFEKLGYEIFPDVAYYTKRKSWEV